jgi:hypothetical protein
MNTTRIITFKIFCRKFFRYITRYGISASAKTLIAFMFIRWQKSGWFISQTTPIVIQLKNKKTVTAPVALVEIPTSRHGSLFVKEEVRKTLLGDIEPVIDAKGGDVGYIQYHLDQLALEEFSPQEKMTKLKEEKILSELLEDFKPEEATPETLLKVRDLLSDILWDIQAKTGILPLSIQDKYAYPAKKPSSAEVLQHLSMRADFLTRVGKENYGTFECIDLMAKDSYDAWRFMGKTVSAWKSILHQTHRFWGVYSLEANPSYLILSFEHDARLKRINSSLKSLNQSEHITDFLEFSQKAGKVFAVMAEDFERVKLFDPSNPMWELKISYFIGLQIEMKQQLGWGYWDLDEMKQVLEFGQFELRSSVQKTYPLESFDSALCNLEAEMNSFLYERRVFNEKLIAPSRSKIHLGNRLVKKAVIPDHMLRQSWLSEKV